MKISKYFLIIAALVLLTQTILAEGSEEQKFIEKGFNLKHYQHAEKLNLDLENYIIYRSNKSNRIKGSIMIGVGSGVTSIGLLYVLGGALMIASDGHSSNDNYKDLEDD